jgi:hypothetical protein
MSTDTSPHDPARLVLVALDEVRAMRKELTSARRSLTNRSNGVEEWQRRFEIRFEAALHAIQAALGTLAAQVAEVHERVVPREATGTQPIGDDGAAS